MALEHEFFCRLHFIKVSFKATLARDQCRTVKVNVTFVNICSHPDEQEFLDPHKQHAAVIEAHVVVVLRRKCSCQSPNAVQLVYCAILLQTVGLRWVFLPTADGKSCQRTVEKWAEFTYRLNLE